MGGPFDLPHSAMRFIVLTFLSITSITSITSIMSCHDFYHASIMHMFERNSAMTVSMSVASPRRLRRPKLCKPWLQRSVSPQRRCNGGPTSDCTSDRILYISLHISTYQIRHQGCRSLSFRYVLLLNHCAPGASLMTGS